MDDLFSEKIECLKTVNDGYATEGSVGIITAVCVIVIGAIILRSCDAGPE